VEHKGEETNKLRNEKIVEKRIKIAKIALQN